MRCKTFFIGSLLIASFLIIFTEPIFSETDLRLRSGINKKFKKPFVLDEDNLRRITGVFSKNSQLLESPTALVYHIELEDDRFYETTDIEIVLSDPNTKKHCIKTVSIELRDTRIDRSPWERDWIARLTYKSDIQEVFFNIFSKKRTWALIFSDEIQPQIERTLGSKKIPSCILSLFFISIVLFILVGSEKIKENISSKDGRIFFEFLSALITVIPLMAAFLSFYRTNHVLSVFIPDVAFNLFGPKSSFLWGDMKNSYLEHEELLRNIKWVVIVGFIISLFANAFMLSLTKLFKKNNLFNSSSPTKE